TYSRLHDENRAPPARVRDQAHRLESAIGARCRDGVGPRLHPFRRGGPTVVDNALRVRLPSAAWFALTMLLGSALLGVPRIAEAKAPDSVLVERLTWTEIRDAAHG